MNFKVTISSLLVIPLTSTILLGAAGVSTATGEAAVASTRASALDVHSAGIVFDNLEWVRARVDGHLIWLLRIERDPEVPPGGTYFLWNPQTSSIGGDFTLSDGTHVDTLSDWKDATFTPDPNYAKGVEVRYGDLLSPESAQVVASIWRCPSSLVC